MFNNHRNMQFGIRDQQEAKIVHTCIVSGAEIYAGEQYLEHDGEALKEDIEVLIERFDILRKFAEDEEVEYE